MQIEVSIWAKNVKMFISHLSIYQNATSSEECFSSANPFISQWAHEQRSYDGRDEDYACTQKHGLPLTNDLAASTAEIDTESLICHHFP